MYIFHSPASCVMSFHLKWLAGVWFCFIILKDVRFLWLWMLRLVFWVIWYRQSDVNNWNMLSTHGGSTFLWNTVTHVPTRCCCVTVQWPWSVSFSLLKSFQAQWLSKLMCSAHTEYLCRSRNKQWLFCYTVLKDWFLWLRQIVFAVCYELNI